MSKLKELMNVKGVTAVGQFNDDGTLVGFEGNMSPTEAAMAAQMCATNKMMGQMQVDGFTAMSAKRDGLLLLDLLSVDQKLVFVLREISECLQIMMK